MRFRGFRGTISTIFSRILLFFNPHLCLEKYFLPTYLLLFFLSVSSQFETVFFFLKHTHPRFSSRCSKSYQENNFESSIVFTLVRNPPGSLLFFFYLIGTLFETFYVSKITSTTLPSISLGSVFGFSPERSRVCFLFLAGANEYYLKLSHDPSPSLPTFPSLK